MAHIVYSVYIGDHASLSFLDFLRHSLKQLVGVTPFTDGQQNNPMLELEADEPASADIMVDFQQKKALFQSYLTVVGAKSIFLFCMNVDKTNLIANTRSRVASCTSFQRMKPSHSSATTLKSKPQKYPAMILLQ